MSSDPNFANKSRNFGTAQGKWEKKKSALEELLLTICTVDQEMHGGAISRKEILLPKLEKKMNVNLYPLICELCELDKFNLAPHLYVEAAKAIVEKHFEKIFTDTAKKIEESKYDAIYVSRDSKK